MPDRKFGIETLCLHAGQIPDAATGARGRADLPDHLVRVRLRRHAASLFNLQTFGNVYSRISNPTVAVFEERMAADRAGRLRARLRHRPGRRGDGDPHAVQLRRPHRFRSTLYGGTHTLLHVNLKKLGIETTFVDPSEPENFRRALKKNTKLLYAETLGNPLINIVDIEAVARIAHEAEFR
jgi:O-acetylhomoserine (thiol)-lyase